MHRKAPASSAKAIPHGGGTFRYRPEFAQMPRNMVIFRLSKAEPSGPQISGWRVWFWPSSTRRRTTRVRKPSHHHRHRTGPASSHRHGRRKASHRGTACWRRDLGEKPGQVQQMPLGKGEIGDGGGRDLCGLDEIAIGEAIAPRAAALLRTHTTRP
jgi:hypothetical protein